MTKNMTKQAFAKAQLKDKGLTFTLFIGVSIFFAQSLLTALGG